MHVNICFQILKGGMVNKEKTKVVGEMVVKEYWIEKVKD